jgi:hypothetical protein
VSAGPDEFAHRLCRVGLAQQFFTHCVARAQHPSDHPFTSHSIKATGELVNPSATARSASALGAHWGSFWLLRRFEHLRTISIS